MPLVACVRAVICLMHKTHPDFIEVAPEASAKMIKIDQIRALRSDLVLTHQYGGYKIALIGPADAMNINAYNSLLKTLEEPAPGVILILLTSRPASLPATIRSRCQKLALPMPEQEVAQTWLAQQIDEPAVPLSIARGAPLAALRLIQEDVLSQRRDDFLGFVAVLEGRH